MGRMAANALACTKLSLEALHQSWPLICYFLRLFVVLWAEVVREGIFFETPDVKLDPTVPCAEFSRKTFLFEPMRPRKDICDLTFEGKLFEGYSQWQTARYKGYRILCKLYEEAVCNYQVHELGCCNRDFLVEVGIAIICFLKNQGSSFESTKQGYLYICDDSGRS